MLEGKKKATVGWLMEHVPIKGFIGKNQNLETHLEQNRKPMQENWDSGDVITLVYTQHS